MIDAEGNQAGVMTVYQAMALAEAAELDLVEIVPNAEPPVCRVMDHGKFLFELNKKRHAAKKNQKQTQLKEIKLRPGTDEGDYQIKLKSLIKFLQAGDKTKITLRFRGREMAHQDLGMKMLQRVMEDLDEHGKVEQFPKIEGRLMVMVISPKR